MPPRAFRVVNGGRGVGSVSEGGVGEVGVGIEVDFGEVGRGAENGAELAGAADETGALVVVEVVGRRGLLGIEDGGMREVGHYDGTERER